MPGAPLPRYLLAAYVLLIAYASLYPLAEWHTPVASPFAFLAAPWPRWITGFDLAANVIAYLPFGALCVLCCTPRYGAAASIATAAATGTLLALGLEALQSYLPARVPSRVDLLTNGAGALLGAILAAWLAPRLERTRALQRWRARALEPGQASDFMLTLLALWLFAQLNPATLLFGMGDLRDWFTGPRGAGYGADLFVTVETMVTAGNVVAVALLVSAMTAPEAPARRLILVLVALALAIKALAFAVLLRLENAFAWFTPGAQQGLAIGLILMAALVALPRVLRLAIAAALLVAATVLVNLAPPNPYTVATLKVWAQGHFLNFNGLTQFVSSLWPFAALLHLIVLVGRRRDD